MSTGARLGSRLDIDWIQRLITVVQGGDQLPASNSSAGRRFCQSSQVVRIRSKHLSTTLFKGGLLPFQHNGHKRGVGKVLQIYLIHLNLKEQNSSISDSICSNKYACVFDQTQSYTLNPKIHRLDYKFDLMYAKRAFVHWYDCPPLCSACQIIGSVKGTLVRGWKRVSFLKLERTWPP